MTDKPKPISFRPTETDRSNIEKIRGKLPWVASDADAIRYALDLAAKAPPAG